MWGLSNIYFGGPNIPQIPHRSQPVTQSQNISQEISGNIKQSIFAKCPGMAKFKISFGVTIFQFVKRCALWKFIGTKRNLICSFEASFGFRMYLNVFWSHKSFSFNAPFNPATSASLFFKASDKSSISFQASKILSSMLCISFSISLCSTIKLLMELFFSLLAFFLWSSPTKTWRLFFDAWTNESFSGATSSAADSESSESAAFTRPLIFSAVFLARYFLFRSVILIKCRIRFPLPASLYRISQLGQFYSLPIVVRIILRTLSSSFGNHRK